MKHAMLFAVTMLLTSLLQAGHHEEGVKPIYQFYHFNAPDPAAVVSAMDKFAASDCGKQMPANIALSAELYNGSDNATHFIIVGFGSHADRVKAEALQATCPAASVFNASMQKAGVTRTSERLAQAVVEVKDWSQDTTFMKFDFQVAPENVSAFLSAWTKLTNAAVKAGHLTNSYGLEGIIAGSKDFSHFVYIGHTDSAALVENFAKVSASSAYAEYSKAVANLRTSVNTSMIQIVKSWPRQ
ncbi:hypothetical protein OAL14_02415 [Gammaproteobacteria bacterium]|nr:hypothetical protein [Gammaproteobacteria bacterium]